MAKVFLSLKLAKYNYIHLVGLNPFPKRRPLQECPSVAVSVCDHSLCLSVRQSDGWSVGQSVGWLMIDD